MSKSAYAQASSSTHSAEPIDKPRPVSRRASVSTTVRHTKLLAVACVKDATGIDSCKHPVRPAHYGPGEVHLQAQAVQGA